MFYAALALAMQTSSTNCYPVGNTVQCDTRSAPAPTPYQPAPNYNAMQGLQAFQMGQRERQQEDAYGREDGPVNTAPVTVDRSAAAHAVFRDVLSQRMAAYIRQSRCRASYDLAWLAGEEALAARSAEICPLPR